MFKEELIKLVKKSVKFRVVAKVGENCKSFIFFSSGKRLQGVKNNRRTVRELILRKGRSQNTVASR